MTHQVSPSTGYGPRMKLMFTGDEQDYDIWEVRFLGYMALQGLKETILPSSTTVDSTKNEKAYAELVMLLDEKSLYMIMTDAIDDDRKALEILRDHYKGTGKPRILTLYNNLCNVKYIPDQGLTEYISRAERLASSQKNANETVSDSLLISMVLKGLTVSYNSFIVVIIHTYIHTFTRLGTDHHQLIMPPISKDCSNTFLERSFIYAAPCE